MTNRYSPPNRSLIDQESVIPWVNVSGEEIPAFGVIQLRQDFDTTSKADKPNSTSGLFFVNGPVLVRSEADTPGESYLWDKPRRVLLAAGVTVGDEVGPTEGSWEMSSDGAGWRVLRQAIDGVGVVLQTGGSTAQFAWGVLGQDTGKDDSTLSIALYQGASLAEFVPFTCGDCDTGSGSGSGSGSGTDCTFLDMDLSLCTSIGSVTALVPAGYKAGPVGLIKMPVCGAGSGSGSGSGGSWQGWTVVVGRRVRCMAEIPIEVECCSVTNTIQFTRFSRIWYFGGALEDRLNPCPTGSGSGS